MTPMTTNEPQARHWQFGDASAGRFPFLSPRVAESLDSRKLGVASHLHCPHGDGRGTNGGGGAAYASMAPISTAISRSVWIMSRAWSSLISSVTTSDNA